MAAVVHRACRGLLQQIESQRANLKIFRFLFCFKNESSFGNEPSLTTIVEILWGIIDVLKKKSICTYPYNFKAIIDLNFEKND
jgi:hypothetical protein